MPVRLCVVLDDAYVSFRVLSWLVRLFFFKQKTAYEMRISDWSSDVCSSDLRIGALARITVRESDDLDDFQRRFDGRMRALSDAKQMQIGRASCRERVCQYV